MKELSLRKKVVERSCKCIRNKGSLPVNLSKNKGSVDLLGNMTYPGIDSLENKRFIEKKKIDESTKN